MKILISAAETSSDAHGAQLLRALRESVPGVEAFGIGGPKLEAEGLRRVVDARELLSMGLQEVFSRLPRILRALKEVTDEAERVRPDLAVVIDYPDFHFRLARKLKRLGIPVIYYIPPKVWVWRKRRIQILRDRFVSILSILPFEVPFYREANVPVIYVGNPVLDELPLSMTREQARALLGVGPSRKVLVAMPGSRPSEIKHHVAVMLDAARRAAAFLRKKGILGAEERLLILMPLPLTADLDRVRAQVEEWQTVAFDPILEIAVSQGNSFPCMAAGDAGLVKSGTSTLEAGLMGLPHVVVYKPSWFTGWVFENVVRYRGPVGLVNLVADGLGEKSEYLMKEILCGDVTASSLASELLALFTDSARQERVRQGIADLRQKMAIGDDTHKSPSRLAADEVLRVARAQGIS